MPYAPKRPCTVPRCPELTTTGGKCARHRAEYEARRGSAAARGYGKSWREIRERFLAERPFCDYPGCNQPATEAHHLTKKAHGGSDSPSNLMACCKSHHSQLTRAGQ